MKINYLFFTRLIILSLLLCLLLFPACKDNSDIKIKLSYSERRVIDTLFREKILQINPKMDSTCEKDFDKNVLETIDSIVKSRRLDEARLRRKIPINK